MNAVKTKEAPAWIETIRERIVKNRAESFEKKKAIYQEKLQDLINLYFRYYSEDEEENENTFNELNKEWKGLIQKVNSTQRIIKLSHDAFEKGIEFIKQKPEFIESRKQNES